MVSPPPRVPLPMVEEALTMMPTVEVGAMKPLKRFHELPKLFPARRESELPENWRPAPMEAPWRVPLAFVESRAEGKEVTAREVDVALVDVELIEERLVTVEEAATKIPMVDVGAM